MKKQISLTISKIALISLNQSQLKDLLNSNGFDTYRPYKSYNNPESNEVVYIQDQEISEQDIKDKTTFKKPRFSLDSNCAKCGNHNDTLDCKQVMMKYCDGCNLYPNERGIKFLKEKFPGVEREGPYPEHMHRECTRCGYKWVEYLREGGV